MEWKIFNSEKKLPQDIMNKDKSLLDEISHPILHFYEWEGNCLTYGYFMDPSNQLDLQAVEANGINMARRPTGGGIIFHMTDFAFSILIPSYHPKFSLNTLENYAWINQLVIQALNPFLAPLQGQLYFGKNKNDFCMVTPTQYDIVVGGKKMGGAAQRKTKKGLLHQGSISLAFPPLNLLQKVLSNKNLISDMQQNSYFFLKEDCTQLELNNLKTTLKQILTYQFLSL